MESKFVLVKTHAKSKGVSAEIIVKVIELIEFAEDNDIELYQQDGKLRMRYTGPIDSKDTGDSKDFIDSLFGLFGKKK